MLTIENLVSGYDQNEILRGIDIEVKSGEIIALIGPNGAGKSTILKSIFGLANIYSGRIIFNEKDITRLPAYELIRQNISYVPQGRQVFLNMTVLENLEMGAYIFTDKNSVRKNIASILNIFPVLKEKQKENASALSGGQQQILAIARALIQNPKLLLLDEPSLGLSPLAMKEIFEKIVEINKDGVSVMIVEQNAKQAVEIAHKTYILESGKIVLEGGKNIFNNKKISDIYFGGELAV